MASDQDSGPASDTRKQSASAPDSTDALPTSHQARPPSGLPPATPTLPTTRTNSSQDSVPKAKDDSGSSNSKLLFLNYSKPSEFKSRSNKRIVKRWASTSQHRSAQFTEWEVDAAQSTKDGGIDGLNTPDASHANVAAKHQIPNSAYALTGHSSNPPYSSHAEPTSKRQTKLADLRQTQPDSAIASDTPTTRSTSEHSEAKPPKKRKRRSSKKSSQSSSPDLRPPRKLLPASLDEVSARTSPAIEKAFRDPFDVLPVKADAHAHELIRLYLNAQLLSPAWTQAENDRNDFQLSLSSYRKSFWFPLVRDSTAAFAALVAYIQCTPGLKLDGEKEGFFEKYQTLALRKANDELADPTKATSDSTLFAITLLMISAQRMNDLATFRIHARGLSLVLRRRREDRQRERKLVNDFERCFDASSAALSMRNRLHTNRDPYDPTSPLLKPEQTSDVPVDFCTLWRLGLISPHICIFHAFTITLVALGFEAGDDHLAASSTVQHIFLEGVQPLPPMNSVESACLLTIRLTLHCFVRPVRAQDDKITLFCIFGIGHALMDFGVQALMEKAPQAVVWMTLVAGSQAREYADSPIKISFDEALRNALELSGFSDLNQTVRYLDEHFLWVPTMYQDALELWTGTLGLPAPEEKGMVEKKKKEEEEEEEDAVGGEDG